MLAILALVIAVIGTGTTLSALAVLRYMDRRGVDKFEREWRYF